MNNSDSYLFNPFFSHIYIEQEALKHPNTAKILSRYPNAEYIPIKHYKDVFCRGHQSYGLQKQSPKLILAIKKTSFVYEGAPVCQSFGNQHFYYTSLVMNCIYDCEYCYLQGMYPSANIVIYVNLEDYFKEIVKLLEAYPVYLCISYDTDLLAFENILGYVEQWLAFARKQPGLTIELRTKCAASQVLDNLMPQDNFILAWTLTPETIQSKYEHHTPSLQERLACINKVMNKGYTLRLCFDPLIYQEDWQTLYNELVRRTFLTLPADKIRDVSLGVFRVSHDYLKQMRKQRPDSVIIQYPYENDHGICHYGRTLSNAMISYVRNLIKEYISESKIYIWKETI